MGDQQPPRLTLHVTNPFAPTLSGDDWVRGIAWIIETLADRRPAVPRSELLAAAQLIRYGKATTAAGDPELLVAVDRLCATLARPRRGK